MKRALKTILTIACLAGIVLAGCEEPDGGCNVVWTLSWLAVATGAGFGLKKLEEDAR